MTRYAAKSDNNHTEIRDGLRECGVQVQDVARHAGLGFDLIATRVGGPPMLLEVKQPRTATRLTESEQAARDAYGDYWRVVTTLEEALAAVGAA